MILLRYTAFLRYIALILTCLLFASCSGTVEKAPTGKGTYKVGNPYVVSGKKYHPAVNDNYDRTGLASWYGPQFHGRKTANGEVFNMNLLTAAHTTLPMPSFVKVTNLANGRSLILRVNDRGPFVNDRLIDVSRRAAQLLGFEDKGVTKIRVQAVANPSERNSPKRVMAAKKRTAVMQPIFSKKKPLKELEETYIKKTYASKKSVRKRVLSDKYIYDIYILIGNYTSKEQAEAVASDLSHLKDISFTPVRFRGENLFRIRLGAIKSQNKAEILLGRILSRGHNTAKIKRYKRLKMKL